MQKLLKQALLIGFIFSLVLSAVPVKANAEYEIDKVLATTSHTPVALMDVSQITSSTSTPGCYVASCRWVDSYGTMSGWFSTSACSVEIRIQAQEGFYFSENVSVYLNNSAVSFSRDSEGRYIDISREYTPDVWAPTVIKHPGGETVEEGGWASFVASATYTNDCSWLFVSPDGKYFNGDELKAKFPTVSVEENGEGKVKVYGIPAGMDGWKAVCRFEGPGGIVDTSGAKITVKAVKPVETPAPEPSPEVNEEAAAQPEEEEAKEEEKEHQHSFSDKYSGDLLNHWRRCDCGEITDKQQHSMVWTVITEATQKSGGQEKGVCSACGYSQTRDVSALSGNSGDDESFLGLGIFGTLVKVLLAVVGIIGGFLLIMYIRFRARRRKYRIKSRRY